jgi:hypothetical protein
MHCTCSGTVAGADAGVVSLLERYHNTEQLQQQQHTRQPAGATDAESGVCARLGAVAFDARVSCLRECELHRGALAFWTEEFRACQLGSVAVCCCWLCETCESPMGLGVAHTC